MGSASGTEKGALTPMPHQTSYKMNALLIIVLLLAGTAHAEEGIDVENAKEAGKTFARCAGRYQALATMLSKENPASSKVFEDTARGASMTSGYFYSIGYSGGKKAIGEYSDMSNAIADAEKDRMLALIEIGGIKGVEPEIKSCTDLIDVQKDIIDNFREQMYLGGPGN